MKGENDMRAPMHLLIFLIAVSCTFFGSFEAHADGPDVRLVKLLNKGSVGVQQFNTWRRRNPIEEINLRGADLRGANLQGANLRLADLSNAKLQGAIFGLNLRGELRKWETCRKKYEGNRISDRMNQSANCGNVLNVISKVHRGAAHLGGADLGGAEMDGADFTGAAGCDEVFNAPPDFESLCANPK